MLSMNIGAYLFKDGYDDVVRNAGLIARCGDRATSGGAADTPKGVFETGSARTPAACNYPGLSLAYVPASGDAARLARAGPLGACCRRRPRCPMWVTRNPKGFTGTIAVPLPEIAGRKTSWSSARCGRGAAGSWWSTCRSTREMISRLYEATGVKAGHIGLTAHGERPRRRRGTSGAQRARRRSSATASRFSTPSTGPTGDVRRATVCDHLPLGELYQRLARAQQVQIGGALSASDAILLVLALVAGLFVVIQIVALIMGLALARSITSSIHELFIGTERVQHGDFTHRISISTKDQLGELADSFNQMTGSIENLLQTAAEKKRLEEELRIARQIQMSLLPRGPLDVPGPRRSPRSASRRARSAGTTTICSSSRTTGSAC